MFHVEQRLSNESFFLCLYQSVVYFVYCGAIAKKIFSYITFENYFKIIAKIFCNTNYYAYFCRVIKLFHLL
jgi:hypothetical protein